MKRIILSLAGLAVLTACNNQPKPVKHANQIEVAVYEGYPVNHGKEFETEAVFIPADEIGIHVPGDTVQIDKDGFVRELPFRYIDDGGHILTDTTELMRVVMHDRVLPNKFIKID